MSSHAEIAPFAAAVYRPGDGERMALFEFVTDLKARGVRVGGLLQQADFDAGGAVAALYAIDVGSERRFPISLPNRGDDECSLDLPALVETSQVIRQAIDARVDLVVVEKFGEQEQAGGGLIDEIMQTIAAGIPLLISVPAAALPLWQERSGELGSVIEFSRQAFEDWWRQASGSD